MVDNLFESVGFDRSLEGVFERIRAIIESPDGCDAAVYKPVRMTQARAAHILPGADGRKKAQQVFAEITPRRNSIQVARRKNARKRNPRAPWQFLVDSKFEGWDELEKTLKEWALDPKLARRPTVEYDFGDGVALPGGLPETNRAKF